MGALTFHIIKHESRMLQSVHKLTFTNLIRKDFVKEGDQRLPYTLTRIILFVDFQSQQIFENVGYGKIFQNERLECDEINKATSILNQNQLVFEKFRKKKISKLRHVHCCACGTLLRNSIQDSRVVCYFMQQNIGKF